MFEEILNSFGILQYTPLSGEERKKQSFPPHAGLVKVASNELM